MNGETVEFSTNAKFKLNLTEVQTHNRIDERKDDRRQDKTVFETKV
jgi:hypothetical protein